MISSLIDELNKSADEWNRSNLFELARMCRDAADTIWELRDDLQRANDAVRDAEHDESRAWDRVRKAEAENAKLRELCRDVFAYEAIDCERCAYGERCKAHETTCYTAGIIIRKRARELGVDW